MSQHSLFIDNLFEKISKIKKLTSKNNFFSNILEFNLKRFSNERIKIKFKSFHLVRLKILFHDFLKGYKTQFNLKKEIKNSQNQRLLVILVKFDAENTGIQNTT